MHRLMAERREVQDRQAPMPERNAGRRIDPCTEVVRAPVLETVHHSEHDVSELFSSPATRCIKKPADSTHRLPCLKTVNQLEPSV